MLWRLGTALVPDASSDLSDASHSADAGDAWDAAGRIWQPRPPAGGRAVAGSNPVAPITGSRLRKRASLSAAVSSCRTRHALGTDLSTGRDSLKASRRQIQPSG